MLSLIQSRRRLRLALLAFVLALGIPAAVLVLHSYRQLQWEAFHQQRTRAQELTRQINRQLQQGLQSEEQRSFADYRFVVVEGDPAANFFRPSSLSTFPPESGLPGVIGYFQVDAGGQLSSPSLPDSLDQAARYGISAEQFASRRQRVETMRAILSDNRLLAQSGPPASPVVASGKASTSVSRLSGLSDFMSGSSQSASEAELADADGVIAEDGAALGFDQLYESNEQHQVRVLESMPPVATSALEPRQRLEELKIQNRLEQSAQEQEETQWVTKQSMDPRIETTISGLSKKADYSLPDQRADMAERSKRREQSFVPAPVPMVPLASLSEDAGAAIPAPHITLFESEIDPFVFRQLNSGHLVLFRKVLVEGRRVIQGLLLDQASFLRQAIEQPYQATDLARSADLVISAQGLVLTWLNSAAARSYTDSELNGELLLEAELAAPFNPVSILFTARELHVGPGARVVLNTAWLMAAVLLGGAFLMYRVGLRQLRLVQQQQNFVSAVSHELKTPLTSIRMYAEMLKQGWVPDNKQADYYDYIFSESERLSRLIANVLQLARMNRNTWALTLKPMSLDALSSLLRSKLQEPCARAGFTLVLEAPRDASEHSIEVDEDALMQILINLVDNALKFAAAATPKRIDLTLRMVQDRFELKVRDYGPGIERSHLKKIFGLFYRAENELTRQTTGTGIGLALARQLAHAMRGELTVGNANPGAEFTLVLPG
jgi:signal transduction histidine kinase